MAPGLNQRFAANRTTVESLVRRATPFSGWLFIGLFLLAAMLVGLARARGATEIVAIALLAAIGVVAVVLYVVLRRTSAAAEAAERETSELRRRAELLAITVTGTTVGLGLIDSETRWIQANDRLAAMLGRTVRELQATTLLAVTDPAQQAVLERELAALRSGQAPRWEGESLQVRAGGEAFPVAVTIAAAAPDGEGSLLVVQEIDISAAKRGEAIRDAMVTVRHALATSATWDQAAAHVLGAMCTNLERDTAQFWTVDLERDALRLHDSWYPDEPALADFDRACRELVMPAGEGVFGRVRQSGVAAAIKGMSPLAEPSLTVPARKAGLTEAVVCPVVSAGVVTGVIALLSRRASDVEDDVMTMLTTVGSEVGQFIQRAATTEALQRSEADHRAIFERAPIGIARVSATGELLEGNAALLAMLEQDFDPLRDHAWPDLLRSYDLAASKTRVAPLLAGFSDGGSVQVRAATGGGRWLWLQMTATSIPDANGRPEHVLVMVEDVTRVRDAQDKIADALEAQRNANADLEKLDRTKTEFLSIVSHEFRTALTGIQGFSELIRDGGLEPDELRAYGGYIFNDADRVNRLIGDMLDLDRMESGRMSIRMADVDINEVLTDAMARAAPANAVEFKPDLDPRLPIVTGDRDRLVQVVSNLVSNAVKYSPEGGTVTISSRAEGGYALITVADTGLGIPPDEIAHVFERFRRVRSGAAQSIAGTGLGLTIVKQIVEMHGGKIWVESAVGHGSAFHFTIPLAAETVTPSMQLRHA